MSTVTELGYRETKVYKGCVLKAMERNTRYNKVGGCQDQCRR